MENKGKPGTGQLPPGHPGIDAEARQQTHDAFVEDLANARSAQAATDARDKAIKGYVEESTPSEGIDRREFLGRFAKAGVGLAILVGGGFGINKLASIKNDRSPTPPKEIPTNFDAAATDQWLAPQNSTQMTLEEYDKIAPPIWEEQSKTMTMPLPIKFRDGRTPTLHIQKMPDGYKFRPGNDLIVIDKGLEQGDIIFSPYDGALFVQIYPDGTIIQPYFLYPDTNNPAQKETKIQIDTTLIKFLPDPSQATETNRGFKSIRIKKGQPIGEILTLDSNGQPIIPKVQITGLSHTLLQENFNLAASEGKGIILK